MRKTLLLIMLISLLTSAFAGAEPPSPIEVERFVQALGGQPIHDGVRLTLYIPDEDREGTPFTAELHQKWVEEAGRLLADLGGGFTMHEARGGWVEPETGRLDWERTSVLYCTIPTETLWASTDRVKSFLYRFGRETRQSAVAFEIDGELCLIEHELYEPEKSKTTPPKDPLFVPALQP